MGLATTPEYDELLARGYPHLRRLITPHPHEADAEKWVVKALNEGDPKHYFVDWPAAVARRYVRGYALSRMGIGVEKAMHVAATDGSVDEAEGRQLIADYLHPDHYDRYDFHVHHVLFLIEAMIGSAATTDAVLGEYEAMTDMEGHYGTRSSMAYALGFVIRRLPVEERVRAEARVNALVAKHAGPGEKYTRDFLSYLVGGRKALEVSRRRLGLYCIHFCDDPALIRDVANETIIGWDAHHVVLAGDALIDALTPKMLRKIWKGWKERTIEQLGHLAAPKVLAVLKQFGKIKSLAKHVEAALAGRGAPSAKTTPTAKTPVAKTPVATKSVAETTPAKKTAAKAPTTKTAPAKKRAKKPAAKKLAAKR